MSEERECQTRKVNVELANPKQFEMRFLRHGNGFGISHADCTQARRDPVFWIQAGCLDTELIQLTAHPSFPKAIVAQVSISAVQLVEVVR